ncbi:MAG TPA: hypothetical protein VGM05_27445 [Planctomycetaceae bacterium]|jgi:hypothetical protein
MYPSKKGVVSAAIAACSSFAECAKCFFNFERRSSWLGWENWLTIDIVRRLNSDHVLPFYPYSKQNLKLDLFVDAPIQIGVEIKTNYITDQEVKKPHRLMSERVVKDARKMRRLGGSIEKLLLVSTFFESNAGVRAYPARVQNDLAKRFGQFHSRWHTCSTSCGHNLLLVLSS